MSNSRSKLIGNAWWKSTLIRYKTLEFCIWNTNCRSSSAFQFFNVTKDFLTSGMALFCSSVFRLEENIPVGIRCFLCPYKEWCKCVDDVSYDWTSVLVASNKDKRPLPLIKIMPPSQHPIWWFEAEFCSDVASAWSCKHSTEWEALVSVLAEAERFIHAHTSYTPVDKQPYLCWWTDIKESWLENIGSCRCSIILLGLLSCQYELYFGGIE